MSNQDGKAVLVTYGRGDTVERLGGTTRQSVMFKGEGVIVSDGYHTMDELYAHRIALFMALCKKKVFRRPDGQHHAENKVWRSRLHSDGSAFDGWFVLGIGKAKGKQITYHLPNVYWDRCDFAETLAQAPEFDGHTSHDVLTRLAEL